MQDLWGCSMTISAGLADPEMLLLCYFVLPKRLIKAWHELLWQIKFEDCGGYIP